MPVLTPSTSQREQELVARYVLSEAVEPGDRRLAALLAEHGAEALVADPDSWLLPAEVHRLEAAAGKARQELDAARKNGLTPIIPSDELWPSLLNDLEEADPLAPAQPLMLWARGDASLLSSRSLAITGARACTGYGAHVTAEIADHAAEQDITVISGAAYGVDAAAHRAALAAGGPTVAVLASGADRAYPAGHAQLVDRIAEAGCVVSEMPPGAAPTRHRFLMRSRIIAAISGAVLVTEAGRRSGALHTAELARGLGRPVGAVPGPVTSASSVGCHMLMQHGGARVVTDGADALALLA